MSRRVPISASMRNAVVERAGFRCEYCQVHEDDFYIRGEIDHIIPIKHGGDHALENLAYSCLHCNRNKGTDDAIVHLGQPIRLFNPRIDQWHEHFTVKNAMILDQSEIALVTIKVLKMNAPERIIERSIFILQGTYPV